jgi:hypothetical protein
VHLDALTVALSSLTGQMACCTLFGFISFVEFTQRAAADDDAIVPFGWPHAAVMGANALAIVGWLAFVRLGQIAPASSFVPVVSLYT